LARVLRARPGQEFDVVAGERVRRGRVASVGERRVEFDLGEEVPVVESPEVVLLLAIYKFDRMEWAIEKLTELGVARMVPVQARRTDARLAASAEKRVERWRRIARQAGQQARRARDPEISPPQPLASALATAADARIVLAETEQRQSLPAALRDYAGGAVALAVGPEGGWSEEEIRQFVAAGWRTASLGAGILRAETAAIAATAVVMTLVAQE
ncbi:MAG: RsmE family RNA methyltransferase, partial [Terriglobales bacterium]